MAEFSYIFSHHEGSAPKTVPRIFTTLAATSIGLLLATLTIGLTIGDLTPSIDDATRDRFRLHFLAGLIAALFVVFVHSIVVVYFIGTSRWCREVVEAYRLDPNHARESARLKRKTFPFAVIGMLTIVGVIALGAASDPATGRQGTEGWDLYHRIAAFAGIAVMLWTYVVEWNHIHANQQVINNLMNEVRRIRAERGLDVEA